MRDYMDLGATTPPSEPCIQVGHESYRKLSRLEAVAYMDQLLRHASPPESCSLRIRSHPHDFGTYFTIVVYYDTEIEESIDYALKCESYDEPWDEESRDWLEKQGYSFEEAM